MKRKKNKDLRKKVSISMPPALIKRLDRAAKLQERNRSNMVCQFIRRGLEE